MRVWSVLLAVVLLVSGLGCQGEDEMPPTGRRASSATRKSSSKAKSSKETRNEDEREASEVESHRTAGAGDAAGSDDENEVPAAAPSDGEEPSDEMRAGDAQKPGDEMARSDGQKPSREMRASDAQKPSEEMHARESADAGREAAPTDTSNNQDESTGTTALTYYKDAKPIIDAKCGICHMPDGIAPIPFTTYAQVKPFTALMKIDVEGGVMPPWLPSDPPGKFVGDRRLTPEQKATFLKWIEDGALEGNP